MAMMTGAGSSLDDAPFRAIHVLAAAAVLGGALLDGYVLGIVGPALAIAQQELSLSALSQGLIASSALIGVFVGGLIFGNLADRYGRKPVFAWNLFSFVVLSVLQVFVTEVWQLVALRLALGLAIGVEYAVGSSVLAEFSRRKGRGMLLGMISVAWQTGFTIAFLVGSLYDGQDWRMLLASSAIPAAITFLIRMRLPESPMWLKAQGRIAEAREVVDRHFGPHLDLPDMAVQDRNASLGDIFAHRDRWQHIYSGLFWFCQVGPFFAIFTFITPVFVGLGIEDGLMVDLSLNLVQILGAVFGIVLLALMSRRGFVIWTFAVMLVTLLAIGLFPTAPLWVVVVLFGTYMFVAPAANNIQFVYPPEIFDTRLRATGVGFSAAVSRISAASAVYFLPVLLEVSGASVAMIIMAAFPALGLVLSIFLAPETKTKVLR